MLGPTISQMKVQSCEEFMDLANMQLTEALTAKVFNWAIIFVRILTFKCKSALKISQAFVVLWHVATFM